MSFDLLNPVLQHHIVNSLGWAGLRPLQEQAIAPLLAGDDALLLAPTAGGKTEAVLFPLLTRLLRERPDVLLTTPESLEAMLISVKVTPEETSPTSEPSSSTKSMPSPATTGAGTCKASSIVWWP